VRSETGEEGWVRNVPAVRGTADLRITALDAKRTRFAVQPWPFSTTSVELVCEGFELPQIRFSGTDQMRRALSDVRRVVVMAELVPDERQ
jgi:hypothetical protein